MIEFKDFFHMTRGLFFAVNTLMRSLNHGYYIFIVIYLFINSSNVSLKAIVFHTENDFHQYQWLMVMV